MGLVPAPREKSSMPANKGFVANAPATRKLFRVVYVFVVVSILMGAQIAKKESAILAYKPRRLQNWEIMNAYAFRTDKLWHNPENARKVGFPVVQWSPRPIIISALNAKTLMQVYQEGNVFVQKVNTWKTVFVQLNARTKLQKDSVNKFQWSSAWLIPLPPAKNVLMQIWWILPALVHIIWCRQTNLDIVFFALLLDAERVRQHSHH